MTAMAADIIPVFLNTKSTTGYEEAENEALLSKQLGNCSRYY